MLLGDKIKELRKKKKITQGELADKMYVSRQTISNWENNKSYPNMDFIASLGDIFNVSIEVLIKEDLELAKDKTDLQIAGKEENIAKQEQENIQKNKYRVALSRLLFIRFNFLWMGTLVASYFYFSKNHLEYIWFPTFFIIFSLFTAIPIEMIKRKYKLKEKQDLTKFLDERYK